MPPHGLFSAPFAFLPPDVMAGYQAILPMEFREVWSREELLPDPDLAAWIMNPGQGFVIDDSVLDLYPGLRLLVTPSTGRNHIDVPACTRRAIPVLSLLDDRETLDVITASAEFTFLLLLNTLRRLDRAVAEVAAG
jgi:lactate dehydrogenase-like 2-hydroxyacid dehydrogenase